MVIDYKNFDDKVRDAFEGLEVSPPGRIWYEVSAGIPVREKKHMTPVFFKIAAVVAFLIVSSVSFWFLTFQSFNNIPDEVNSEFVNLDINPVLGLQEKIHARNNTLSSQTSDKPSPKMPASPSGYSSAELVDYKKVEGLKPLSAFLSLGHPKLSMNQDFSIKKIIVEDALETVAIQNAGSKLSFLSLGMHFAPQYSYRYIVNPAESNQGGIPFEYLEDPIFSFNLGLSVQAKVLPWMSVQSGFNYGTMGQFVSNIIAYSHPENLPVFEMDKANRFSHPQTIVTSQGNIRLSDPTLFFADSESYRVITNKQFNFDGRLESMKLRDFGVSQYFTYLEVPVLTRFKVGHIHNAEFFLKAGGALNYILGNVVFLGRETMVKPIGETYGLRKFNFSALSGFAVNISLNSQWKLTFEPTLQMYLMPMVRDQLMLGGALPFQYSLFTGLSYSF